MKNRRAYRPTALGTLEVRITPSSLGLDAPSQVLAHHTAGHEALPSMRPTRITSGVMAP